MLVHLRTFVFKYHWIWSAVHYCKQIVYYMRVKNTSTFGMSVAIHVIDVITKGHELQGYEAPDKGMDSCSAYTIVSVLTFCAYEQTVIRCQE